MIKRENNKVMFLLFFSILLIGVINANGLSVISNGNVTLTKLVNDTPTIIFTIQNQESFPFTNINFESNPYITMSSFNLSSGASVNVTGTITATNSFNGPIRIQGFFNNTVNSANTQNTIEILNDGTPVSCDLSVFPGETVVWHNQNSITNYYIINSATNQPLFGNGVPPTQTSTSITMSLNNPFTYFISYTSGPGGRISNDCVIQVLGTGLVNDRTLDGILNLNVNIIYQPTTISVTIPSDIYSIVVGQSQQGFLSITNTGTNPVKGMKFSGDWFTFKDINGNVINSMDLNPGSSTNILYNINPAISNTNQTNQNYTKPISITGNFNTYTHPFVIFIPFASVVGSGNGTQSFDDLIKSYIQIVTAYCNDHKENTDCQGLMNRINAFSNTTNSSENSIVALGKILVTFMDQQNIINNQNKQSLDNVTLQQQSLTSQVNDTNTKITQLLDTFSNTRDGVIFVVIVSLFVVGMGVLTYIRKVRKINKLNDHTYQ